MTVTHCQALNGVGSAWNDLIHHNRFGNFRKSGCFCAEISERFKREQRRRSGPRTVAGMFRNKRSPDSHKRKRCTLVFLHSQTELPDVCLSMIHSLGFAPLCHVKSMLSREARVSHVGFGSALGNKWIILDALPYLCDWGARSLIFKKEIIAQHVINVTSEQWPALCITPAAGVLLHLCDQLWLLTPHAGCLRRSIWKIKPLTLEKKKWKSRR